MIGKPCLECGEVSDRSRCPEHRPKDNRPRRDHVASPNNAQWKRVSARVRRTMPWCLECGATTQLSADHLLPVSAAPELAYAIENLTTRCLSCNGKRGNRFTHDEALAVLKRLQWAYQRRPTRKGRERVNVALRLAQTRGDTPEANDFRPVGKAKFESHIGRAG